MSILPSFSILELNRGPIQAAPASQPLGQASFADVLQSFLPKTPEINNIQNQGLTNITNPFVSVGGLENTLNPSSLTNGLDTSTRTPTDFNAYIQSAASSHDIHPNLIKAIIQHESSFNPNALSHAGAMGLMQLMPGTARYLNVQDAYNPEQNINGGTRYIREMLTRFDEDLDLALAAYNAGPGNVERYGGIPPFQETQRYVNNVQQAFRNM